VKRRGVESENGRKGETSPFQDGDGFTDFVAVFMLRYPCLRHLIIIKLRIAIE